MSTVPIRLSYTGLADAVRLATWMPRFEGPWQFQGDGERWYLDLDLPPTARIEYRLDIDRGGWTESVLDPMNPHVATNPFGHNSVLTGPEYVEPSWVASNPAMSGALSELRVNSKSLGGRRAVKLYRRPGLPDRTEAPLLVAFDGSDYATHAGLLRCVDALTGQGAIPPMRVLLSDPRRRHEEYVASDLHAACVLDEILPYVYRRVATASVMLLGASLGAVAAWKVAAAGRDRIAGAILQSGTFARGEHPELDEAMTASITRFVDAAIAAPLPSEVAVHQSCGRYESLIDWNSEVAGRLGPGRERFTYTETWTGHDWGAWRDQLEPGLRLVCGV